jgi:uncharacterized membrane protein
MKAQRFPVEAGPYEETFRRLGKVAGKTLARLEAIGGIVLIGLLLNALSLRTDC